MQADAGRRARKKEDDDGSRRLDELGQPQRQPSRTDAVLMTVERLIHSHACKSGHLERRGTVCRRCGTPVIEVHIWALVPYLLVARYRARRRQVAPSG